MSLCAHAVKDKATARYKRVIRIYMYAMHVLPGGITCRVKLPLSQLAPDRFKTLCDRKFSNLYVLSLPLHDASHLFYATKWSHQVASEF